VWNAYSSGLSGNVRVKGKCVQSEEKVGAAEGDVCSGVKVGEVGAVKSHEKACRVAELFDILEGQKSMAQSRASPVPMEGIEPLLAFARHFQSFA